VILRMAKLILILFGVIDLLGRSGPAQPCAPSPNGRNIRFAQDWLPTRSQTSLIALERKER
jgi:hypothetical protein